VVAVSGRLRVLHTADVHLAAAGAEADRWRGFVAVLAAAARADLLVVAGDMFDHARVGDALLDAVAAALARTAVPVVVVPGNHDLAGPGSPLDRLRVRDTGGRLQVLLDPDGGTVEVPGLDVTVWGRAMVEHSPRNRPLAGHRPPDRGRWHLVLAHGHFQPGAADGRSSPITAAEIDALDCDYLALGHWHRRVAVGTGRVAAGYPGPPVPEHRRAAATADLIRISGQGGVAVSPVALA
jgi:DNA repair protein SbcD/Mre11